MSNMVFLRQKSMILGDFFLGSESTGVSNAVDAPIHPVSLTYRSHTIPTVGNTDDTRHVPLEYSSLGF